MARSLHLLGLVAVLAALSPLPAQAQFNPFEALFGAPPRPPAGVPTGRQPQQQQQQQYPEEQYRRYPNEQYERSPEQQPYPYQPQQPYPPQANVPSGYPPRANVPSGYPPQANVPPGYPPQYPPQANVPPGQQPGGVQSQPLPPPPAGTAAIEPRGPGASPVPGAQPLPGQPPGQRPAPGDATLQPGDEVVTEPPAQKVVNKGALFSGLDKITGRIINFDVSIGETVQFGALQVTPRACYTRPPTETPNTDAFVEVDEVTLQGEVKRIFTGWMFAASPGLHGVEHPIYDVWLSDCKSPPVAAAPAPEASLTPNAQPVPIPPRRPAQRPQAANAPR